MMGKREAVLSLLDGSRAQEYIPAGFFIHFARDCHRGQAAVDKHLEYYRYTGMDFVKIQYENAFPRIPAIKKPDDWAKIPLYEKDFYADHLMASFSFVPIPKTRNSTIMKYAIRT